MPVAFGLSGTWCPAAGRGAGHGVQPVLLVQLGPSPSHAPRGAGLSGDVAAAPCPPTRAALHREASLKLRVGKVGSWLRGQEEVGRVGVAEQRSAGNISLNACPSLLPAGICGEQPCGTWCRSAAAATLRVPAWRLGARDCLPLSIHSLMFPVSLSRNNLTSGKRNQRWPQLLCVLCKQPHLAEQPSPSARTDNTLLSGRWLPRG